MCTGCSVQFLQCLTFCLQQVLIIKWWFQTKMLILVPFCTVIWSSLSKVGWMEKNHGFSPLSQKNWSCTRKDLEDTEQGLALRILQNCLLYSGHRFAVFTIRRTYSHFHMGMWQPSVKCLLRRLMQKRPELFQIFVREQAVHAVRSQTIFR